jgi:hypothetical protein
MNFLFIYHETGLPLTALGVPSKATKTTRGFSSLVSEALRILHSGSSQKIFPSVIKPVAIFVVPFCAAARYS